MESQNKNGILKTIGWIYYLMAVSLSLAAIYSITVFIMWGLVPFLVVFAYFSYWIGKGIINGERRRINLATILSSLAGALGLIMLLGELMIFLFPNMIYGGEGDDILGYSMLLILCTHVIASFLLIRNRKGLAYNNVPEQDSTKDLRSQ
ncbi:MAG: hypothetical protein KW802_01780 [Candidatus Doudnabacteria bacterium]|nr:hypothetical protein [Candidatus Doudnabacteria bacterium]